MEDLKLAAKYSLMPHRLKYAGQGDINTMLYDYVLGKKNHTPIKNIMEQIHGLYLYLKLIGEKNDLQPFDKKVIEGYWVGNELIKNINSGHIRELILKEFTKKGLPESSAEELAGKIPEDIVPHHSFHVFHIHSITGKLLPGTKNLDSCRISSGKVKEIYKDEIIVSYRPIIVEDKLSFGNLIDKKVVYDKNFIKDLRVDDKISFHWNFAIEKLSQRQVENLEEYTKRNMDAMNSL